MFRRQRGITLIGWVILLVPVAILAYVGIRLVPIYLNYMRVAHSVEQTASEMKTDEGTTLTPVLIRATLGKHFDIESITFPDVKDVSITRDGSFWLIEAKFEDTAPLFGNISMVVDFDKVGKIGG
jgi:Tfp pilus assembly major pilin PilA